MGYRRFFRSEEADQKRAVRAWVGTHFPARGADADEERDAMEQTDFAPVHAVIVMLSRATVCLGISCWLPSEACEKCQFYGKRPKKEHASDVRSPDTLALMDKFAGHDYLPPKLSEPEFGSRIRAQIDQLLSVSTCRGGRARAELHGLRRMGL